MTRARELSKLANTNVLNVSGTNVGIGTTIPTTTLQVAGIVSATSFVGNITGTASTATAAGTASTATAAGTAYGLTGSPNITVGNITGTGIATISDYDGNFILDSYLFNS